MSKTRTDYGSGVARSKIEEKDSFELKSKFLKELRENTFSGSDNEDANEHIKKVLKIVDLFHIPNIAEDQLMLRVFLISLTRATSRWLRNEPTGSIKTWEDLKTKFLNKYCPPSRTAKKMEEINNFQQELDETLYQGWKPFKELGVVPTKTTADVKKAIQEMAEYSQKWHNGTSKGRSTKTYDGLAAIQAQLNNLGREIKKVNEKVYVAQVGCEQCKGPHYTKDCLLKEKGKTLEEAYYTQFGGPFQGGGYRATAPGFYQRNNANPSYQERRKSMADTLSKFIGESAKRQEENSNLIKEIRASTDAAIRNQGASIKTFEEKITRLDNHYCKEEEGGLLRTLIHERLWSFTHIINVIPERSIKKSPKEFHLPCFINITYFHNAIVDLGASFSVMPLLTYLNLGLGELAHAKLTVELADRTVKYPKGIAKNVLVGIEHFCLPRAMIYVYKRKITLRVGEEKIVFKSVKPASSIIKRVYMLSLREIIELDLEARLMGETLVLNRSLDPFLEDYIELNDLNEPFVLRRNQGDDLMPTIKECEVIEEFRTRDEDLDTIIDDYPSYYDDDNKIHIDCAHNLKFSCIIGFEFTHVNFFPLLYVNVMSKKFHNSIMKDKMVYKGDNVVGALMNVPIFVGTFSIVTDFAVLEDMDAYRDDRMGDVIVGEPFLREVGIKAIWFD
ncbi:pyruvate dehydrogenase (acetyl-transferring) kinase, mitochondrial [Tanacetum coccineum]